MADEVERALAAGLDPAAELLGTGRVDRVFGAPVQAGEHVIVPVAEVFSAGGTGFGFRRDVEGGGGGGGGAAMARPVAVVVVGPDGVRVRPVLDVTKVGLALISAVLALLVGGARLGRRSG